MKLIVGLGNPGNEYQNTRHNMGFMVIDRLCAKWNVTLNKKDFKAEFGQTIINGEKVLLVKPQTYMNLSGESIAPLMNYYKIDIADLVVVCDDLSLPVGKIRLRAKGSSGGQNGLKNIIKLLKSEEFKRIKIGIGRNPQIPVVDYVLGKVSKEDQLATDQAIDKACEALEIWVQQDFNKAMNACN